MPIQTICKATHGVFNACLVTWLKGDIYMLESVQRKAVKMVAGLKGELIEERCKELNLYSLEKRRWDQDLKQTFKILHRTDKLDPSKLFKKTYTPDQPRI